MTTEAQKRASKKYHEKHKDYYNTKSNENAKKMRMERNMYKNNCEKAIEWVNKHRFYFPEPDELLDILERNDK